MSIFLAGCPTAFAAEESLSTDEYWKLSNQEKNVTIYSRPRPGSPLKEFKAVGSIDAPTSVVSAVIDDFLNYPKFMPYTTECRLIKRDGDSIVGYQRLSPKVCADRDYTLRVWKKSWPSSDGLVFMSRWSPANELGPPEKKGVVRVKLCEGKWLLEPDGATKTRATYFIYTDTGGFIPSFIANRVSVTGITKLFAAVRTQVKDPRYAVSKLGGAPPTVGKAGAGKNQQARVSTDERSKKPE
ncbi:MAG TPA: START domain-containing protein [Candidatus Udaeobacter sp.]